MIEQLKNICCVILIQSTFCDAAFAESTVMLPHPLYSRSYYAISMGEGLNVVSIKKLNEDF